MGGRGLLLAALSALVGACAPVYVSGVNVDGSSWVAVSVVGRAPVPGSEPTLQFDGGRIAGTAGCNGYAGQSGVSVTNERLQLPELLITTGNCIDPNRDDPSPVMEIEHVFWGALTTADRIFLRGERLVIAGPNGELVFDRAP